MSAADEPKTKLVAYDLAQVFRLKHKIETDTELLGLLGSKLTGSDFRDFAEIVHGLLPAKIPYEPVESSLLHLAGNVLTKDLLHAEAWRLAGNQRRLRRQQAVPPWRRQLTREWVPLQVVDERPRRNRRQELGSVFTFRALAGTSAGLLIERFWTRRFAAFIAPKIGFTPPWGDCRFEKLAQFMSLRLYGLVEPERSFQRPFFEDVAAPVAAKKYNRLLLRQRQRVGFKCPKNWATPCYHCPIGYDRCRCGTHPRTFVVGVCSKCGERRWIDPLQLELQTCVDCYRKELLARRD